MQFTKNNGNLKEKKNNSIVLIKGQIVEIAYERARQMTLNQISLI